MSTFEELQTLLVLSGTPVWTGERGSWEAAELRLGRPFPDEYRKFVATYGSCTVDTALQILNPFDEQGRFWDDLEREVATEREFFEDVDSDDPGRRVPRPKGMIPWGSTIDGGACFWVATDPDPRRWTVFEEWELYGASFDGGMVDYLTACLRGEDRLAMAYGFPSSMPAYVDPLLYRESIQVDVDFGPSSLTQDEVMTILRRVFAPTAPHGGCTEEYYAMTRPGGWILSYGLHRPSVVTITIPLDDVDSARFYVVALADALDVRIVNVSHSFWADLVHLA